MSFNANACQNGALLSKSDGFLSRVESCYLPAVLCEENGVTSLTDSDIQRPTGRQVSDHFDK
jgi:hypothetical protein